MQFSCNEGRICVSKSATTFACECPTGFQYVAGYYIDIYVTNIYIPGYCNGIFHHSFFFF